MIDINEPFPITLWTDMDDRFIFNIWHKFKVLYLFKKIYYIKYITYIILVATITITAFQFNLP